MNPILKLILEGERLTTSQMAEVLDLTPAEVEDQLARLEAEGVLLGWRPVLNPDKLPEDQVRAVIELRISPEREGGFDRVALRVSRFQEVETQGTSLQS